MPIYEFGCEVCGEETEEFQKHDDLPPECCDKPMKKLVSGFKMRKGGGLYSVDTGISDFGDYDG